MNDLFDCAQGGAKLEQGLGLAGGVQLSEDPIVDFGMEYGGGGAVG